ncbi:MAG: ArsR family transcriptional regulator [Acidobacteria bacterium OLB17]|nr:MAG: ArsR family transcriptional regulator [Acidobacteria bacterium OLB17]MCZ2391600.1 metalloregulator ArsR/SmtB family transcription factor [Acidobacteriota bacterium]
MTIKATEAINDVCEIDFVDAEKVKRVRQKMKPAEAVTLLADTFKLLGDPTRVRIAFALAKEELCVCDIANLLNVSQSAVSHSLRTLRQMKLVRFRRVGKIAYYTLDDDHIANLLDEGFRHVDDLLGEK